MPGCFAGFNATRAWWAIAQHRRYSSWGAVCPEKGQSWALHWWQNNLIPARASLEGKVHSLVHSLLRARVSKSSFLCGGKSCIWGNFYFLLLFSPLIFYLVPSPFHCLSSSCHTARMMEVVCFLKLGAQIGQDTQMSRTAAQTHGKSTGSRNFTILEEQANSSRLCIWFAELTENTKATRLLPNKRP